MGFEVDSSSMDEAENKISGVKDFAMKALGALGIGFSLAAMNDMAEEFNAVNDQIRNATVGLGEQSEIQDHIMRAANDTRMSYEDTAKVVSNLVQENSELFGTVDEAVEFNNAATMLFKTAGKSNEQIAGLMESINNSFARGSVDSGTISALLEQSPEAVKYLTKQLGCTSEQLEQMAAEGKMSVGDLRDAFVSNADEIKNNFGELDYNISDAMLNIRNSWGKWLADMNSSIGLTDTIAKYMESAFRFIMVALNKVKDVATKVIDKLGGMDKVFKIIGIAAAAMLLAFKGQKILGFLKTLVSLLNMANLKILAIIAVFVIIALIVEDFINFMQGNNSVIGDVLKKMGVDVEEVRGKIIGAWEKVKGFLLKAWAAIKDAAKEIVAKLREFWTKNGDEITSKLSAIWKSLVSILKSIWNSIKETAILVFGALKAFWEKWGDKIKAFFTVFFDTMKNLFNDFISVVKGIITIIEGLFSGDLSKVWEGVKQVITGVWDGICDYFSGIWDAIYAVFGDQIDKIVNKVTDFVEKVKEKVQGVKDFFGGIGDAISGFFGGGNTANVQNSTIANSTGKGNKTNNVSQDVTIQNTFNGTDQKNMSDAAGKSASDTTSQLARGLAYGK